MIKTFSVLHPGITMQVNTFFFLKKRREMDIKWVLCRQNACSKCHYNLMALNVEQKIQLQQTFYLFQRKKTSSE